VHHLQSLVRINTSNPPGNETEAARYLDNVLRAEGYEPVISRVRARAGNLVARLKAMAHSHPFYSLAIPTWCPLRRSIGHIRPLAATWLTAACGAVARWT